MLKLKRLREVKKPKLKICLESTWCISNSVGSKKAGDVGSISMMRRGHPTRNSVEGGGSTTRHSVVLVLVLNSRHSTHTATSCTELVIR